MATTENRKTELINKFKKHEKDSGSADVQVALFTERINQLNEHFKSHEKDHHSRHGMLKLVSRRRKLLDYLKKQDAKTYQRLIDELGIRK